MRESWLRQMERNGELKPLRLQGAQGEAWALVMSNNEWFDGEDGIAYSAQQRFLSDWRENLPASVVLDSHPGGVVTRDFPTYREACAFAVEQERSGAYYAMVKPR